MVHAANPETDWRTITERRLQSVQAALALLKESKSGQRELHDARVACRQAEAALIVCRDLFPTKPVQWLRQYIRKIRRATNEIRDRDVLRLWLKKQRGSTADGARRTLKQQRQEHLGRAIQSLGNLTQLREHVSLMAKAVQNQSPMDCRSSLARRLLQEVLRFLRCIPLNDADTTSLHEFRIAGKRLRYACELATEVNPEVNFQSWLKRLQQMQARLGQIHDTAVRIESLKQFDKSDRAPWLRESRLEQQRLTREWISWWRSVPWENAAGSAVTQIVKLIRESR